MEAPEHIRSDAALIEALVTHYGTKRVLAELGLKEKATHLSVWKKRGLTPNYKTRSTLLRLAREAGIPADEAWLIGVRPSEAA